MVIGINENALKLLEVFLPGWYDLYVHFFGIGGAMSNYGGVVQLTHLIKYVSRHLGRWYRPFKIYEKQKTKNKHSVADWMS